MLFCVDNVNEVAMPYGINKFYARHAIFVSIRILNDWLMNFLIFYIIYS